MSSMKRFFHSRTVGFYLSLAGALLEVVSLILYGLHGVNEFASSYLVSVFVTGAIAAVTGLVSLFFEYRLIRQFSFLFALYAFIAYVGSQANYLASLFVSIDETTISVPFVLTTIFLLVAFVLFLVSVFFSWKPAEKAKVMQVPVEKKGADHE